MRGQPSGTSSSGRPTQDHTSFSQTGFYLYAHSVGVLNGQSTQVKDHFSGPLKPEKYTEILRGFFLFIDLFVCLFIKQTIFFKSWVRINFFFVLSLSQLEAFHPIQPTVLWYICFFDKTPEFCSLGVSGEQSIYILYQFFTKLAY